MHRLSALFLAFFVFFNVQSLAQESIQDWSKKVVELQELEGQNFDRDLVLVKGYLYLHRRVEALTLLSKLIKQFPKKESVLSELFETASQQFFYQETSELHADALQFIQSEIWSEAKDKIDIALQKENGHQQLVFRGVQIALALGKPGSVNDLVKLGETIYSDQFVWKILFSWHAYQKEDYREIYRVLNPIWLQEKKKFESDEAAYLIYLKMQESLKFASDWVAISKIIQKNPHWVGVRLWRLKNKVFTDVEKTAELKSLQTQFELKKKGSDLKSAGKKVKPVSYFSGLVQLESVKKELDSVLSKISEKD